MSKKLFFALNATDPLAKDFLPIYKKLKITADRQDIQIKWVPLDNFHITVTFLGNQPEKNLPALEECLKQVCSLFEPFDLKVEDIGAFASEHEARVLWLGVQNKKYFGEMKQSLDTLLLEKSLLVMPDEREFTPHLTIARLRNPRSVKDMISPFKRKSFGKIHVHEIVLYESIMQGAYPVYKPLFRSELTGKQKPPEEEAFVEFY